MLFRFALQNWLRINYIIISAAMVRLRRLSEDSSVAYHPHRNNYERKNQNPKVFDFLSVGLRKRKRKKISGTLKYFVSVTCCCGLCVPNMIVAKASAKESLGNLFPFPLRKRKQKQIPRF